ncbi:MAG: MFS transporter small subunit [Actinopolymorphaceae bacterium]
MRLLAVVLWLWVAIPFGYGLYQLLVKVPALFGT